MKYLVAMPSPASLATLAREKYLSLETFRRSGVGVRTPVWFATVPAEAPTGAPETFYVYAATSSGKAKRIRANRRVRIAACDSRGRITGPWFDARAAAAIPNRHEAGGGVAIGRGVTTVLVVSSPADRAGQKTGEMTSDAGLDKQAVGCACLTGSRACAGDGHEVAVEGLPDSE